MRSAEMLAKMYESKMRSKFTGTERTMITLGMARPEDFQEEIAFLTDPARGFRAIFTYEDGALVAFEEDVPEAFDL